MANVRCSVRALKHNIRTLNRMINQEIIPVVKCRSMQHGKRITREIARSYRHQPLFVYDKADVDYIKSLGIDNLLIQQVWDGTYDPQVVPVLTADQFSTFNMRYPYAVFSAYKSKQGVSPEEIPEESNLKYVFYHEASHRFTYDLDEELQDSIDAYRAVNPSVVVSVGSTKDALEGKGLYPRVGAALYGYGQMPEDSATLRPVKEVFTKVLMQEPEERNTKCLDEPYGYIVEIGSSAGMLGSVRLNSKEYPDAYIKSVPGSAMLCTSVIKSNVKLKIGTELSVLGENTWRALNGSPYKQSSFASDLMMGDPDVLSAADAD